MAKTNTYVVTNEMGTEQFTALSKVAAFIGVKKITKADVLEGKYPNVVMLDGSTDEVPESADSLEESSDTIEVTDATNEEVAVTEEDIDPEDIEDLAREHDVVEIAKDNAKTKEILAKVEEAISATSEAEEELFDQLCSLEDSIQDAVPLTDELASLLVKILNGEALTDTHEEPTVLTDTHEEDTDIDTEEEEVEEDTTPSDSEYPEVGDEVVKDEKAMKKYIKSLSDESLREWCMLEGAEWKPNDHASINRMRMAMAIKAIHFPNTAPKASKKSKSKYASYSTEDLVGMALENEVEVPDDKGNDRILRMYTIMALRKAGIIE